MASDGGSPQDFPELIGAAPFQELLIEPSDSWEGFPQQGYAVRLGTQALVGQLCTRLSEELGVQSASLSLLTDARELKLDLTLQDNGVIAPVSGAHVQLRCTLADGVVPQPGLRAKAARSVVSSKLAEWQGSMPGYTARPALASLLQLTTECSDSEFIRAGACTAYGPRPSNEDAHVCLSNWATVPCTTEDGAPAALFAVCDGHGGSSISEQVGKHLGAALASKVAECRWSDKAERADCVKKSFVELDAKLRLDLADMGQRCGSTCSAALVWPQGGSGSYKVLLANLGDSRSLLYRAGGDCDHLVETHDHKPDNPLEKKRIRAAGGYVLPADDPQPARLDGVLALSRAFGNFRFKDESHKPEAQKVSAVPDIFEFEAKDGDVLVLACDGVFDVLSSVEVAALAMHSVTNKVDGEDDALKSAAASIVWAALDNGTQDNVTCVVAKLGGP